MGFVYTDIAVSADGFAAGPRQSEASPLGEIDEGALHAWMFEGYEDNRAEVDGIVDSGATIMGRNMFAPCAASGPATGAAGGATSRRTTGRSSS